MGSDGVFDNVYDEGIETCLQAGLKGTQIDDLDAASVCIAKKAEANGKDKKFFSPFAKNAMKHLRAYMGGKEDDISVIVA